MMAFRTPTLIALSSALLLSPSGTSAQTRAELTEQVRETESAFARTMAQRDFEAFTTFLSEEAIFFSGKTAIRGKEAVAEAWKPLFDGPDAPFSWEPETVEVLDSGTLAHSSGPVRDPEGNVTATFNSIWRRQADGSWRVVFDKGCANGSPSPEGGVPGER